MSLDSRKADTHRRRQGDEQAKSVGGKKPKAERTHGNVQRTDDSGQGSTAAGRSRRRRGWVDGGREGLTVDRR